MKKVLIPTKLDAVASEILKQNGSYDVVQDAKTPLPELAAAHPDAYALIVRSEKITPEIMDLFPSLKVVIRAGAGYDTIDTKEARKRGIDVMNTPGANANAVAEEVVALMLADARHVVPADASTRSGAWEKSKFMGREITGKTVGIVGLGNIGRLVAKRLAGFECRLLGYDPLVPFERAAQLGIKSCDLETLFRESDFITLHIPENNETRGSVNEKLLGLMKPGATLVNCARAGIVNEDALRAAKADKDIRFLTDVYPQDAAGPKSVADIADIMMPHLGASTYEANENAARRAAEELVDFDEKGVTSYIVNRDIPAGLDPSYCELACLLSALARGLLGKNAVINRIETSFYGNLAQYDKWLMLSLLSGIWDDIDRSTDYAQALQCLADNQVQYINREVDNTKHYDNSITLDLVGVNDRKEVVRSSVRGTLAENQQMVARIDEFDRLYWVPAGNALFFEYKDRPGVIGAIGRMLADAGVNIEDMRNPFNPATGNSLAILNVSRPIEAELVDSIAQAISASVWHSLTLP
ncbi:MAG: NAD(P)-dependent oxidoreductase [Kiritimatiellia bacterium]|jgi:D-3-phosphoglycerate dehydrogenase